MKKYAYAVAAALFFSFGLSAQDKNPMLDHAATITAEDLKKHLFIIASDEYEGRNTGEKGQKMAAEYIANEFKAYGLQGPVKDNDNPYYQPFELVRSEWDGLSIKTKKKTLATFEDFSPYGSFSQENPALEIVFAGHGVEHENYSDYKDLDVKGKAVAILPGLPTDKDGNNLLTGNKERVPISEIRAKARLANEKGAAMLVVIDPEFESKAAMFKNFFSRPGVGFETGREESSFGLIYASFSAGAAMLGTSAKKLQKAIDATAKKKTSQAGKFKGTVSVTAKRKKSPFETENVLGYLEGTDLKDELLVVTAHYDHIGVSANGEINNGANDDGSGTVTVLELAQAFSKAKEAGHGPRRSILFMTVTGEEVGLLGSKYYSDNPVFPIANTIVNLNIDMVGRHDNDHTETDDYIYIIGSDMLSTELHNINEEQTAKHYPGFKLDYRYNSADDPNRFYYRSDHYNFAKHGIPVIFYFNGTHEDYHQPGDTPDKINYELAEKTARVVFATAWELANRDQRPVVDKGEK